MKYISYLLLVFLCLFFSQRDHQIQSPKISKVEIETIVEDSLLNVRAIEVIPQGEVCVFLTSNGNFGFISKGAHDYTESNKPIVSYPISLNTDSTTYNFRSMAVTRKRGMGLTIGNPALVLNIDVDKPKTEILYREEHENVFYDAMDFWNDNEGIAIGDPTDDCMSIIITRDGGKTWEKLACDQLPKAKEGEAAFAASDTNIAIVGDHTWVATGGKASRILYSSDKGKTWEVFDTPIVQGKETTGMYSIDFYDEQNGFAIGGDYTKAADSSANKIRTKDGGKTWQLVAENQSPGYRSCVQYVPNGAGNELVAIGFKGIDYSNDSGESWKHLSDEGFYTIRFLNDSVAYAAGRGRVSKLIFKR